LGWLETFYNLEGKPLKIYLTQSFTPVSISFTPVSLLVCLISYFWSL